MKMIFELHAIAIDGEYNFSRYFSIWKVAFINNILQLQISFVVLITFSILLPMISLLRGIILLTPRFYAKASLSIYFKLFLRSMISTTADYTKGLLL